MARRQRRSRQERRRKHAAKHGWATSHSVITGAGLSAGAVLGIGSSAQAAVMYVDRTDDPDSQIGQACTDAADDCSLRGAITLANTNGEAYDYVFLSGLSGTISLTGAAGGEIRITRSVYLYGDGADELTIAAAPNSRIFDIDPETTGDVVGIYDVTLTGGNVAGDGGAIRDQDATLRIASSVLSGNTASGKGGAIHEAGGYNDGYNTFIDQSTLSGNTAYGAGGAVNAANSFGQIFASTIAANTALSGESTIGTGAGIFAGDAGYLFDSTISGNSAAGAGGLHAGAAPGIYNTIIANSSGSDLQTSVSAFALFSLVESLSMTSAPRGGSANITGVDPQLGGLAMNGGPTPTLNPAADSPVIDCGSSGAATDQRNLRRPVDLPGRANSTATGADGADIGSVELQSGSPTGACPNNAPPSSAPTPTTLPAPRPSFNLKAAIKKCKKKFPNGPRRKRCIRKAKAKASSSSVFSSPAAKRWAEAANHPFRLDRR